jgi:plastocyanin
VNPRFSPSMLTLHRGDSVLVTNKDSTDHTFTIASMGKDSGDMGPGATYRLRFPNAGTFNFVCTYHESLGMKGTVKVTA